MNIAALLARAAMLNADRDAWRCAGTSATYSEFVDRVARLAGGLRRAGIQPGDRVVLCLPNGQSMMELLWAVFWAGGVAVPVNVHLHQDEVAYVVRQCGASLLIGSGAWVRALDVGAPGIRLDVTATEFSGLAGERIEWSERDAESPAWLFYTSGTTGRAKGATLTHRNLWAMTLSYYADLDASDGALVHLHAAPLSHGSGLYLLPAVGRGAINVIAAPPFDPERYLSLIDEHRVTHATFLAPTMLRRLVDAVRLGTPHDLTSLRSIVVGGAALLPTDLERAIGVFGPIVTTMYGQGESPMTIAVLPARDVPKGATDPRRGSVGRGFTAVLLRIADADGQGVPQGVTGEIWVRGDTVMAGYWDNPAATSEALVDGWLRTGDIGHLDDAGYLFLTDRSKDVIISGGSNIYPREVEEVLAMHPDVLEVAVVGVPDAEWGESVAAFVVLRPGSTVDDAALIRLCRDQLASFKKPRTVTFLDDLPRNPNGKVLKRELRDRRTDSR